MLFGKNPIGISEDIPSLFFITKSDIPIFYTSCFDAIRFRSLDSCCLYLYDDSVYLNLSNKNNIVFIERKMFEYPEYWVQSLNTFYGLNIPVYVIGGKEYPKIYHKAIVDYIGWFGCFKHIVIETICKKFFLCPLKKPCIIYKYFT